MVKVCSEVTVYETNGEPAVAVGGPRVVVESHWNHSDRIVLRMPDGQAVTVLARDIRAAIDNATNTARF